MPVKKTTAAKKTTAKKKVAAKSAAPALAKKVAAKKTVKKSASASSEPPKDLRGLAEKICTAIKDGDFDGFLAPLDDALNARLSAQAESKSAPAKKTAEKKVSASPKRNKKTVTPETGKTYKVGSPKKFEGAKVKFIRFKADSENQKVVVEMVTEKPGYPKGKRIVLPVAALS